MMYISHTLSHTLLPTDFIAEILFSNKHLTKCDHVISVQDKSWTERLQFLMALTIKTTVLWMWDCVVWYIQLRTRFCNPKILGKYRENGVAKQSPNCMYQHWMWRSMREKNRIRIIVLLNKSAKWQDHAAYTNVSTERQWNDSDRKKLSHKNPVAMSP